VGTYFWYVLTVDVEMDTAKLFQTGRSQAVRLPKEFRMPGKEVKIRRDGNKIILEPLSCSWDMLFQALDEFPEDFMASGREQPPMQDRDEL
jgi:antitoxin VapB